MKSLFSPFFRGLDQEIAALERRIELRRALVKEREQEMERRVVDTLTSPLALAGAALLGVWMARGSGRKREAAPVRKGWWAGLGGVAMTLLQMRFGSPYQWVARAAAGMHRAARERQAMQGASVTQGRARARHRD